MSGLLLCTKQATNPLYVENGTIRIFNLEELCYYLYNHTYMITIDFFDENFIEFCEKEIEQPALVQRVKEALAHKDRLKNIILKVLSSSTYYSEDEIKRFESTLSYLDSSSVTERLKARADMMVKRGKYKSALVTYNEILNSKEETMSLDFIARIYSNMGVVYSSLFMYNKAAECFEMAYEKTRSEEYRDYLMCAVMMQEDEGALYELADKYCFGEGLVDEYKKAFENAVKVTRMDEKYNQFINKFRYDGKMNLNAHYENVDSILLEWKDMYRKAME